MTTHTLKTDPAVFADVLSGAKTFEIRFNDRDFQPGDTLRLLETEHDGADMRSGAPLIYTGREVTKTVSHILTGYGLADGWCCLSFAPETPSDAIFTYSGRIYVRPCGRGISLEDKPDDFPQLEDALPEGSLLADICIRRPPAA